MPSTNAAEKNYTSVNIGAAPGRTKKHFTRACGYLGAAGDMSDLRAVRRELDSNLELGQLIHSAHEKYVPIPMVTHYDFLPQVRMARAALTLRLDLDTSRLEIVDTLTLACTQTPVPLVVVEEGACQRNVLLGEEVHLTEGEALPRDDDFARAIPKNVQERVLARLGD